MVCYILNPIKSKSELKTLNVSLSMDEWIAEKTCEPNHVGGAEFEINS